MAQSEVRVRDAHHQVELRVVAAGVAHDHRAHRTLTARLVRQVADRALVDLMGDG